MAVSPFQQTDSFHLDTFNNKIQEINSELQLLNNIPVILQSIQSLESGLNQFENNLNDISSNVTLNKTNISSNKSTISSTNTNLNNFKNTIEPKVNTNTSSLSSLSSRLSAVESKLNNTSSSLSFEIGYWNGPTTEYSSATITTTKVIPKLFIFQVPNVYGADIHFITPFVFINNGGYSSSTAICSNNATNMGIVCYNAYFSNKTVKISKGANTSGMNSSFIDFSNSKYGYSWMAIG